MRLQQEPITSLPCLRAALLAKPVSQHKVSNSCRIILQSWLRGEETLHIPSRRASRFPYGHKRGPKNTVMGRQGANIPCKHAGIPLLIPAFQGRRTDEVRDPQGASTSAPSRPRPAGAASLAGGRGCPLRSSRRLSPARRRTASLGRGGTRVCPAPPRPYLRGRCRPLIPGEALAHPPSELQRDTGAAPGPAAAPPPGTAPWARRGRGFPPRRIGACRAAGVSIAVTADSASRGPPGAGPSPAPAFPQGARLPEGPGGARAGLPHCESALRARAGQAGRARASERGGSGFPGKGGREIYRGIIGIRANCAAFQALRRPREAQGFYVQGKRRCRAEHGTPGCRQPRC